MEYPPMKLHEDSEAFAELIEVAAESIGLPQVYVEKDYWVTRSLKYLSGSPYVDMVVFKGGTSLSKAHRLIQRFSEDIDLAVFSDGKGDAGRKKLLKNIESTITTGLIYLPGDERESKGSKYRKTVYQYPRAIEETEFGQASSELVVEVNAFTCPEPFEKIVLQSLVTDVLIEQGQSELISQYGLEGFTVNVLAVRRTLVEKMLGVIKDSYHEDPAATLSGRIRHLYDICMILREEEHKAFVRGGNFKPLYKKCIEDEKAGFFKYSGCLEKPLAKAPLFSDFENWRVSLESTYNGIFSELVHGPLPDMNEIKQSLQFLYEHLK